MESTVIEKALQKEATKEKKFRFWMPLDKLEKSKDKEGKDIMVLGGIASTVRKDTDGEELQPSGFDISYLKEKGIVNWNHGKDPDKVIGEPTKAVLKKAGLYVESTLYPDSELAQKVYKLAETLQKNSKSRRLGYSIEGKAIERDITDPNSVTKALITGVAITICPKNPDSIIDIIKGEFNEFDEVAATTPEPADIDELFKRANGGTTHIVDIVREDGMRIVVDKDYNIKISKAEHDEEKEDETKKSLTTASGAALTRESVEGVPKILTKGEVYEKIFDKFGVIDLSKANLIFETLNNLTMANKDNNNATTNITDDVLEKALQKLGGLNDDLNKGEETSQDETETAGSGKKPKQGDKGAFKKAADAPVESPEDEDEETEEEDEKPKKKPAKKAEKIEKSETPAPVAATGNDALAKAIVDGFGAIGTLLKGINDKLNTLNEGNEEIQKGLTGVTDAIEDFGNTAPPAKSQIKPTKPADRNFAKANDDEFNKGEEGAEQADANTLSITKNKAQVLQILDKCTFEKGFDNEFAGALTRFENTGNISGDMVTKVKTKTGIQLVQ